MRRATGILFAIVAAALGATAEATVLSLDTGKSLTLQQGQSGSFTFSFTNDAGAITEDFVSWTLGIQLLPVAGATGSLTLGALAQPATSPMPVGAVDLSGPLAGTTFGNASINGTASFSQIVATATETVGTVASAASYNMGTVGVTASANALGTWNMYAIQQGGTAYQSYWTNASLTDTDFGNLPRGASTSVSGSLLVGTVTVSAVPEPGVVALAGSVGAVVAYVASRWRRAGRRHGF